MTLGELIDGPRPSAPERDELWLALRSEIREAELGGPFDPRKGLVLEGAARAAWLAASRAWLVRHFASDPRVDTSR